MNTAAQVKLVAGAREMLLPFIAVLAVPLVVL
jgi:hypothetical protein